MDIVDEVKSSQKKKRRICIICAERKAEFCIRGMESSGYCRICADEHFSDLSLLEKL